MNFGPDSPDDSGVNPNRRWNTEGDAAVPHSSDSDAPPAGDATALNERPTIEVGGADYFHASESHPASAPATPNPGASGDTVNVGGAVGSTAKEGMSGAKLFFHVDHEEPVSGDVRPAQQQQQSAANNFTVVDLNQQLGDAAAPTAENNFQVVNIDADALQAEAAPARPPPAAAATTTTTTSVAPVNLSALADTELPGGAGSLNSSQRFSRNSSFSLAALRDENQRKVDLENELQAARLRFYDEVSGPSTLDFLRETGQAVFNLGSAPAPDAGADGNGTIVGEQKAEEAVPIGPPPQTLLEKSLYFITDALDIIPTLFVRILPSACMSDSTKNLLFADFSNTMRNFFHTNILSMPFVIRQAGLVGGILLLSFVALTSEYATEAFFGAKNQMKRANSVVLYGDVPNMIWGGWYPMLSFFYGIIHLIGFLAFASSNARVLLAAMGLTGGWAMLLSMVVPSLLALPFVFFKRASSQPPLAVLSNLLVLSSVVLMFIAFPYNPSAEAIKLWPSRPSDFYMALGISVYAFTGVGSAIPVERTMAPKRYIRLLRVAILVAYGVLLAFGLSGYLSYGARTCSVMTVSLSVGPMKTAVSTLLFVASIFIIPQQTFSFCELCDRRLLGIRYIPRYWEWKPNVLRVVSLIGSLITAYVVPYYGLILSISGSFGCGIVGLVVPAALDYVRRERWALKNRQTFSLRWWEYIIVFGLGLYGVMVVIVGVVFGMYNMWITIQTNSSSSC